MKYTSAFLMMFSVGLLAQGGPHQSGPYQSIEGNWLGSLEAGPGVKLRLAFHIAKAANGDLMGTMDSLDQGATGLPLASVSVTGQAVAIALHTPPATYTGTLNADATEITGNWNQGPASLPLHLKKVDAIPAVDRPQEPKGPFPYRSEDIAYPSKAAGVTLAGTLTMPETGGPFPAVLLITGSGAQNRNEELMGHKPFWVIADFLTRRGIAVLRVDDRGTAQSTGVFGTANTADFVEDAAGSFAYLAGRKEIDGKRIGLIGHSEGAVIAPALAGKASDVAFVVMLAGTGVPGRDVMKAQAAAIMHAGGMNDAAITGNASVQDQLFTLADPKLSPAQLQARKQALEESLLGKLPEEQRAESKAFIHGQVEGAASPWMRYFVDYDPAPALRALKVPVLVLNGALDQQVLPAQNLPAIVKALEGGGNPDYEVVKFPGLNHLFQTAKTGAPSEYAQIPETIAPVVLETIAAWIQKHTMR